MTGNPNAWLNELSNYFSPSPTQFDGAKSHSDSIKHGRSLTGASTG